MTHNSQLAAGLGIIRAVLDTVREVGRAPRGTVYAALMAHGASHEQFAQIESICLRTGLVESTGDYLVWTGPAAE